MAVGSPRLQVPTRSSLRSRSNLPLQAARVFQPPVAATPLRTLPSCGAGATVPRTIQAALRPLARATCKTSSATSSVTHRSIQPTPPFDDAQLLAISPLRNHPFDASSFGSVARLSSLVHDVLSLLDVHDVLSLIKECLCYIDAPHPTGIMFPSISISCIGKPRMPNGSRISLALPTMTMSTRSGSRYLLATRVTSSFVTAPMFSR